MRVCPDFQNTLYDSRAKFCFGLDFENLDGDVKFSSQTTCLMSPDRHFPFRNQIAGDVHATSNDNKYLLSSSKTIDGAIVFNESSEDLHSLCTKLKAAKAQAVIQPLPTNDASFISQDEDLPLPVVYVASISFRFISSTFIFLVCFSIGQLFSPLALIIRILRPPEL